MLNLRVINMGDDNYDLSKYYRCQTDICFSSQLYGDRIVEHGSKVLMLFAEVYSFLVKGFSAEIASLMIVNYSNSDSFKLWFWKIKHALGIELQCDPNYNDIGKWVGKGFLLKIVLSTIMHNKADLENKGYFFDMNSILLKAISKQEFHLSELLKDNWFTKGGRKAIEPLTSGYILLGECVYLDKDHYSFFSVNKIK